MDRSLSTLTAVLALAACSPLPAQPSAPPAQSFHQPIVNGQVESDPAFESVGMLDDQQTGSQTGFGCTGTLIAPNVVLTAAHCTFDQNQNPITPGAGGWESYFVLGTNVTTTADDFVQVRQYIANPSYDPNSLRNDIAVAILSRDMTGDGQTLWAYPHQLDDSLFSAGTSLLFVGYGITQVGGQDSGTRRFTSIPIVDGCSQVGCDPGFQFLYTDNTHGTCHGDSGGPAIENVNGTPNVVGVTSYGPGNCVDWGVDTRVDAYAGFIQGAIGQAGASENCSNGVDDDGDGQIDCADPDCQGSPHCVGPVQQNAHACEACSQSKPCDTGLACVKSSPGANTGICHAPCSDDSQCSGGSCATFSFNQIDCLCPGQTVGNDGDDCYFGAYCHPGSLCPTSGATAGKCTPRCDQGQICATGTLCSGGVCVPDPNATGSTGSTGSSGTGSGGAGSRGSSAHSGTSGSPGGGSGTAGGCGCGATGNGSVLSAIGLMGALVALRRRRTWV